MDINQSSLSRYKTSKPGNPRSITEPKSASSPVRANDTSSTAQNTKQLDLKEGQLVKGQVIDNRFNEVHIQITPGNQVITAKLDKNVPLSIGQEASFQVTEASPDHLVLKYIPIETTSAADTMIQKALTASGLPTTDKNRALVSELLNHSMPIDKQTLQTMIKLSYMNREASPLTLILMNKNNISMTPENIKQFGEYQNGTHQLLNKIQTISENISKLVTQPGGTISTASQLDGSLSSGSILIGSPSSASQSTGSILTDSSLGDLQQKLSVNVSETQIDQSGNPDTLLNKSLLNQGTSSAIGLSPEVLPNMNNPMNKLIQINGALINILLNNADNSTESLLPNSFNNTAIPEALSATGNVTETLSGTSILLDGNQQNNATALSNLLNSTERTALQGLIDPFIDNNEFKNQITNGTASLQKVLGLIQENLATADGATLGIMLQSPEYTKLLESAFLQKWTITPEKLAKKTPLTDLYQNLQEDMKELTQLVKASNGFSEELQIREPVKDLQQNLQFMKDLNQAFTYLQLPMQLKDKKLHSDLYVFSRKKTAQGNPEDISVLLHLDMTNLGSLNIHLQMKSSQIQAKFYLEKEDTVQLIKNNIPLLEESLKKKGYILNAELASSYVKPDFSKDFIEQNAYDSVTKRYTFDIRT